jgi:hypothetical protein
MQASLSFAVSQHQGWSVAGLKIIIESRPPTPWHVFLRWVVIGAAVGAAIVAGTIAIFALIAIVVAASGGALAGSLAGSLVGTVKAVMALVNRD